MKKQLTALLATAVLLAGLTGCSREGENISSENNISDSLSESSDSGSLSSTNSEIKRDDYIPDSTIINQVKLNYDTLSAVELENATNGLKCETLFSVQADSSDLNVRGLYADKTDVVLWVSNSPDYNYFWLDNNGKELQHIGFDFDQKDVIPDYNYPDDGVFKANDGVRYYQNGRLQKTVQLPECHRGDFTSDYSQYLYINKDYQTLTLYSLDTETSLGTLVRNNENYRMDFVDIITDKLAAVIMLNTSDIEGSEYNGEEKFRTLLVELPTMKVIQELPYGAHFIALNDGKYLMTRHNDDVQRVSCVTTSNGEFIETQSAITIDEAFGYFHSNHFILSPDKKTLLLRYNGKYNENGVSYMQCKAISTDTMQVLWECQLPSTISGGFYTPAVITDNAVAYISGFSFDDKNVPLYRIAF